jgi:hypothetical protein
MGAGHEQEFLVAELSIGILIQTFKEMQALLGREVLDARHEVEFLFRDESIAIAVGCDPSRHEGTLRTTLSARFAGRGSRLSNGFGLSERQARGQQARNEE